MPVAFQLGFNALLKMPSGVSKTSAPASLPKTAEILSLASCAFT